ncbi:ester cyclase [uncultured Tateyamaria sp.]|uniref:ester cyclase n=1 Tax=uncultured Tateyamaria sp. TaxID=455651 RepID=UPI00261A3BE3|nr:ester cyclase [uncultured Tateyamaria sp.]
MSATRHSAGGDKGLSISHSKCLSLNVPDGRKLDELIYCQTQSAKNYPGVKLLPLSVSKRCNNRRADMSSNATTLQCYFDEVWNKGNVSSIAEYFSPRVLWNGVLPTDVVGADEITELVYMLSDQVQNVDIKIDRVVDGDPWLSALISLRGNAKASGAPVFVRGQVMVRFENGVIAEVHNNLDNLTLYEQLGQLPKDTVGLLMGGSRLQ